MTIYLDMDGVLADFDDAARRALGTDNSYKWEFVHGTEAFWRILDSDPMFWHLMKPMPDLKILWSAVKELRPEVLTALPSNKSERVALAKREWIRRVLGDAAVHTCLTKEKPRFCKEGDILVDDRTVNEKAWRDAGGRFILHQNAMSTISILKDMKVLDA